ncbi:MAG TPA: winged helix DNA-binding protein [Stellaceae bacterium]|nr:winged helix DNA-binding protein [Stellaceae bacterium]
MSNPKDLADTCDIGFDATHLVRDTCLCLHLQRAARAVSRRFDAAFRPLDLTNLQFSLLMSLNRPGPATMRSVATLLAMDRTTLTAALKPLARRGLVGIAADPADRRSKHLALTAAGRRLLAAALPIWRQEHAALDALLADRGAERLRAGLLALG